MPPDPTCPECDAELIDIDMAEDPDDPTVRWNTGRCPAPDCDANADESKPHEDIHSWFGLSYASYLVVNRSLLQSMPQDWQHQFVACLWELSEQFSNITEPDYSVLVRDTNGRFGRDPIPNYSRGRTFIEGTNPVKRSWES